MPDPAALLLFAVPFALAAAAPGPAQIAMVVRVTTRGRRAAWPFVGGMVLGNACWLLLAAAGLSALAMRFELLFLAVKWAGVAYLLFVAFKLWTAKPGPTEPEPQDRRGLSAFPAGLALTLGNPKALVFFGAVLPQAVDFSRQTPAGILGLLVIGVAIDFGVQSAYVLLADRIRRVASPAQAQIARRSAAAALAGCAAVIAARR